MAQKEFCDAAPSACGNGGLVIAVDKPLQWTSFQVVNKLKWHIRRQFGLKKLKIGHAGTLDPMATGLLLVCVGKATKLIDQLQNGTKTYSGTMVFGATTPCYDLEQSIDRYYPYEHLNKQMLEQSLHYFVGNMEQIPPHFSAVKVDGQRAYTAARNGEEPTLKAKQITVYDFQITDFREGSKQHDTPAGEAASKPVGSLSRELYRQPQGTVPSWLPQADFRISCSKGTYIRSLARDLGTALGSGAFLSALRREQIGEYGIDDALKVDEIESTVVPTNKKYEVLKTIAEQQKQ